MVVYPAGYCINRIFCNVNKYLKSVGWAYYLVLIEYFVM